MKQTLIVAFAFVGVFLSGAVVGGLVSFRFGEDVRHEKTVEQYALQNLKQLGEALELTPDQRQRIRPLLVKTGKEIQAHRRQSATAVAQVGAKADAELRSILTEEQRLKYDEYRERRRERDKRWQEYLKTLRNKRAGDPPPADGPPPKLEN